MGASGPLGPTSSKEEFHCAREQQARRARRRAGAAVRVRCCILSGLSTSRRRPSDFLAYYAVIRQLSVSIIFISSSIAAWNVKHT
eukprot:2727158-Pleurochrysis_carterae.AAC.1